MVKPELLFLNENIYSDDSEKTVFYFYNETGKPWFKTKEIYKKQSKIVFYPYSFNKTTNSFTAKKIKTIEFRGWTKTDDIPIYFRTSNGYGFAKESIKKVMSVIYRKIPKITKLIIELNGNTKIAFNTAIFDWDDLEGIIKEFNKEKALYDKNRKILINNQLAQITPKITHVESKLQAGELEKFLNKFESFEKITEKDLDSITRLVKQLPVSKIRTTSHFIETKERIDKVFIEDIIKNFEKLFNDSNDLEERWQEFFTKSTWLFNHLFPYQVILRKDKAYVGGKTIENSDGRIVDYLFQCGFQDNYALLEIKTHQKELIKKNPYRSPSVFPISDELSGGVNQCLDQKNIFISHMGTQIESFDPKCVLIIGTKSKLNAEQRKCFELYRNNQKHVDIITFDELLTKIKGMYKILLGK